MLGFYIPKILNELFEDSEKILFQKLYTYTVYECVHVFYLFHIFHLKATIFCFKPSTHPLKRRVYTATFIFDIYFVIFLEKRSPDHHKLVSLTNKSFLSCYGCLLTVYYFLYCKNPFFTLSTPILPPPKNRRNEQFWSSTKHFLWI